MQETRWRRRWRAPRTWRPRSRSIAIKSAEYDPAAATVAAGRSVGQARRSDRRREHRERVERLGENRERQPEYRPQPDGRAARPRPRRFDGPRRSRPIRACRSPTTRTRSRPACAGRRCSKISSCARRSPTSTTSASPSGSSTRAGRRRTATSSATKALHEFTRASLFAEAGKQTPVFVRFSTVAGRARLDRHGARRARLRREVLHGRRQLGSRRQQHPGLLHPGRDEVPRSRARRQARAALRDAAGRRRRTTRSGTSPR